VRLLDAPTTLTLMGLGAFPASDPRFLGMLGMHGTLEANLAMHQADLVVCVGRALRRPRHRPLSTFCPHARKIHIDIDPSSIDKVVKVDAAAGGRLRRVLAGLLALPELEGLRPSGWRLVGSASRAGARATAWLRAAHRRHPAAAADGRLQQRSSPGRDAIVSTDVGQHQMWAAQYLRFDARAGSPPAAPAPWATACPPPSARRSAHPESLVVCVSGDASVLMNIQELSTAVQHRAPVKVVLSNNGYMGMVRQWQELNHGNRLSHSWNEALPDFVALAKAFGWGARRVDDPAELEEALAECLAYDGPFFLDVQVAAQENCFPMMPSGQGTTA
jgi:acetolactate synthase-1/2/3 large subunit